MQEEVGPRQRGRLLVGGLAAVGLMGAAALVVLLQPGQQAIDGSGDDDASASGQACEREGYPCSWSEAEPDVMERSWELLVEAQQLRDDGADEDALVTHLEAADDVAEVSTGPSGVSFRLEGGLPEHLLNASTAKIADDSTAMAPSARFATFEPAGRAGAGNDPGGKRAIVIEPYGALSDRWSGADLATALGNDPQYGQVDHVTGDDLDFAVMASLDDYDVVHISSHGTESSVAGQRMRPYFDVADDGSATLKDDVVLPEGVRRATDHTGSMRFTYSRDFFRAHFPGGLEDTLLFADWCRSSQEGLAEDIVGDGSAALGWSQNVAIPFAARSAGAFWEHMLEGRTDTVTALEQVEADDLIEYEPDASFIDTLDDMIGCSDGDCVPDGPVRLVRDGEDLRALDAVTSFDSEGEQIDQGTTLDWNGTRDDGVPDALDEVTVRVDGVADGTERDAEIELVIDGEPLPETIPLADGRTVQEGPRWATWEVTAANLELPFDVTEERLAPEALAWEARVHDGEGGTSVHEVSSVHLEGPRVEVVHPELGSRLEDGDTVRIDGQEGDGVADDVELPFEVTDVDERDIEDYHVELSVFGEPTVAPITTEVALEEFSAEPNEVYRHRERFELDGDVDDDTDELTVTANLVREGQEGSSHEVDVVLEGDEGLSGCAIDYTWNGTYLDYPGDGDPQAYNTSGSKSGAYDPEGEDDEVGARISQNDAVLRGFSFTVGSNGLLRVTFGDSQSELVAPGETGPVEVPASGVVRSEAPPSSSDDNNHEGFNGEATLTIERMETQATPIDELGLGDDYPEEMVAELEGRFEASLISDRHGPDGLRGEIDVEGEFRLSADSCGAFRKIEEGLGFEDEEDLEDLLGDDAGDDLGDELEQDLEGDLEDLSEGFSD